VPFHKALRSQRINKVKKWKDPWSQLDLKVFVIKSKALGRIYMALYIWKEERLSEPRILNTAIYLKIYSVFKFGGINNDSPYST